jgi:hypothetical protein
MPHQIGYVDDSSMLAHYAMLETIADFCESNDWTILRYDDVSANRELIMMAPGLSGDEEIYLGVRTYQNVASDYYNLCVAAFTGYVSGNSFDTQPGVRLSGVPAHNQRIDYWMTINGQRLALALKVGTPVYTSAYIGKFLPYATPSQYPYPVVCAGMLDGAAATRFSTATGNSMPYKGNRAGMAVRFVNGSWTTPYCHPWGNGLLMEADSPSIAMRPTETTYPLLPIVLHNNSSTVYGELDGIYAITGFDNAVENTLSIGGNDYVVIQDLNRTGFIDYYAMRLDPNP